MPSTAALVETAVAAALDETGPGAASDLADSGTTRRAGQVTTHVGRFFVEADD